MRGAVRKKRMEKGKKDPTRGSATGKRKGHPTRSRQDRIPFRIQKTQGGQAKGQPHAMLITKTVWRMSSQISLQGAHREMELRIRRTSSARRLQAEAAP